jgi:uncharacterized protein YggE
MLISNFKPMLDIIKKSKIAMNLMAVLIVFVLVYIGVSVAYKISQIQSNGRVTNQQLRDTIVVTGEAETDIKPDVALISLGVTKESKNIAQAQDESSRVMNEIVANLKEIGIKEKDLKTTNYSIYPKYDYNPQNGKSTLVGYEVSQNLQAKIRDFSKISSAIQKATDLGANQIGGLNFIIDNEVNARSEARGLAIKNAQAKAKVLAQQLEISLGGVVNFSESGVSPQPYYDYGIGGGMEKAMSSVSPTVEPGTNNVSVNVYLTYEILR